MTKSAVCYIVHDDIYYLAESLASFRAAGEAIVFVSRVPWNELPGDWERAAAIAKEAGAEVILGEWTSELAHRQAAFATLRERGFTHAFIPDGDEIVAPELLQSLIKIAESELADRASVFMDTYWKTPEYVIRPREPLAPVLLLDLRCTEPIGLRNFAGGRPLVLPPEHGVLHHLSYVGPDERIRRKIATWGHRDEVQPDWYEQVWLRWDRDKLMRNLHPTHPPAYGFAERIHVPELLRSCLDRYHELCEKNGDPSQVSQYQTPNTQHRHPTVSVVIPLHGGAEDIRLCLESLAHCHDLLHEIVVVDNASPDNAADIVARDPCFVSRDPKRVPDRQHPERLNTQTPNTEYQTPNTKHQPPNTRIFRNPSNLGFAAACNRGMAQTTGDIVLFLNSDTVVPRAGLLRLIEALTRSGSIAAAGPLTNYAGHGQQIAPTYTSLDTLDLFAEDFAGRDREDVETDMLVGFCLAVRRSVLEEVGGFDEQFGLGTFEDNDLCYRMRRAGYRLVIASRSFIHHSGSRTMRRMEERAEGVGCWGSGVGEMPCAVPPAFSIVEQMRRNERLYRLKWQTDIESGYASHLSGLSGERIVFQPERHPEKLARRLQELALRADISLCMIVKDEERVLADCLRSARPFFREMIIVDTGSTDRTKEIAGEMGAKVYDFPWTNSFSEARNESLRHAKGRWIFWMDADDTLPLRCGEALLHAALNAPPEVVGFVVPVQFVEEGIGSGTRVDHVKLFRNRPGLKFEGRIHEQILPCLRQNGGQVARCDAFVLHSGYDSSPEGQAKKRVRDALLLKLDLEERPDHPFVLFNLGMTDFYGGQPEGAVGWLKQCLEVSAPTDSHVRKAYALLALSLRLLDQKDACLETLRQGLAVTPDDPELHFHLAHVLTEQEEYAEARRHYLQTVQAKQDDHFSSVDIGILGYKTYHNLGSVCLLLEDYREARQWWRKAIEAAPQFSPSVFALFDAGLAAGDFATSRQMLEATARIDGIGENWLRMGMKQAESLQGPEAGSAFLRQVVAEHPHSLAVQMAWARHLAQNGQEAAAREPLQQLAAAGVAEAAYFLGVSAIRQGRMEEALHWMQRAAALNPGHEETQAQVANLCSALKLDEPPSGNSVTMEEAIAQVASDLNLDAEVMRTCIREDTIGGYHDGSQQSTTPDWPGGCVWEEEGRMLYALVRALKPEVIIEIGSLIGCSTSHLALGCLHNGGGKVYAVDPALEFSRVPRKLLDYIVPVKEDVFTWQPPESMKIALLFEDGSHEPCFTQRVMEKMLPILQENAVVVSHDYHHARLGKYVAAEFQDVLSGHTEVYSVRIGASDCGLGYAKVNCEPLQPAA